MNKLVLLDAYALIYRAYYAFLRTPRINSRGLNTSAILGFVNTLDDVLNRLDPSHIAVVFDPGGPTFRHEIDAQYKATRQAQPEDITQAIPYIVDIVKAYRIPVVAVPGYEADDVIGTLATRAAAEGMDVLMMTPDKDYGQLVSERVHILRPGKHGEEAVEMGPAEVAAKWGLQRPEQVLDLLALMGDVSDNVPGCPGVGEKTAVKLLTQFGSIDEMLLHTDQIKGALRKKVEEGEEKIRLSQRLVTIVRDVPVELATADFARQSPDRDALIRLYEQLEFRGKLEKLRAPRQQTLFDVAEPEAPADAPAEPAMPALRTYRDTEHTYTFVDSDADIDGLIEELMATRLYAYDSETTSLDTMEARLVGISFATAEGRAYYVPIPAEPEAAEQRIRRFGPLFEDEKKTVVGHNIKYDILVLANYGMTIKSTLADTMVAHYLLQPEQRHSLDYLAETLLGYATIHIDELIGPKGRAQKNMRDVEPHLITDYAAEDADVALRLYNLLLPRLHEMQVYDLFHDVEMPLVRVLADMERTGVIVDREALGRAADEMNARLRDIEASIRTTAGVDINLNSPRQIGELLFERLRLEEKPRRTKTGQYVTDEETLQRLASKHAVVQQILDYRECKKLLSTYVEALPRLINSRTGRVHTSFNQTVTATGRLSSSNPNLQNIPIRYEQGREIRRAFVAGPGCRFVSADYSQVELRLMAHLSGDEHLCRAFREERDVHSITASRIFNKPLEEVDADMRRKAKTINFGIIYGMSVFGMSERLGIARAEAKQFIDDYFANFAGVKLYMDHSIEQARRDGYVETVMHRRRYLPDINSRNGTVRGFAERNAINAPIQGTAADIIKIAMVRIAERLRREHIKAEMILQVHDELNFNCPEAEVERLTAILREEMEGAYSLSVPLRVEIGVGSNWLEAH